MSPLKTSLRLSIVQLWQFQNYVIKITWEQWSLGTYFNINSLIKAGIDPDFGLYDV